MPSLFTSFGMQPSSIYNASVDNARDVMIIRELDPQYARIVTLYKNNHSFDVCICQLCMCVVCLSCGRGSYEQAITSLVLNGNINKAKQRKIFLHEQRYG